MDLRSKLYGNILLSGGNMKFRGMKERLHKELEQHILNEEEYTTILNAIRRDQIRYSSVEQSTIEEKHSSKKQIRIEV